MLTAGLVPDMGLFPVPGFLHRVATARAIDVLDTIEFSSGRRTAIIQRLGALETLELLSFIAVDTWGIEGCGVRGCSSRREP